MNHQTSPRPASRLAPPCASSSRLVSSRLPSRRLVARALCLSAAWTIAVPVLTRAQADAVAALPAGAPLPEASSVSPEQLRQAGALVEEAFIVAGRSPQARTALSRGAALLPRLDAPTREVLTPRWIRLMQSSSVPRSRRLDAYASFFDVASRVDLDFARRTAMSLPDAAARAGAFIDISEQSEKVNYTQGVLDSHRAQQAARQESDVAQRARALTFVAYRMANLEPENRAAAVAEAASQARLVSVGRERDYLLTEIVGASAKFDLSGARRIAETIGDTDLKGLATARVNMSEISQTTLAASSADRIAGLAKAAARYDVRAIPILIQLPPQSDVLKSLSDALPPIYPTARPAINAPLLERMWAYTSTAQPSVPRDELQSRLARLMILHDLWRGRDWGKQLAWSGGRVQAGAFLSHVLDARQSAVRAEPLQDLAAQNINRAIAQSRTLPPSDRVEALLLIAGQILG